MSRHRREPLVIAKGTEHESADRVLVAVVVAIQKVEADPFALCDRRADLGEHVLGRIAKRSLPEAEVAGGHVDVAGQPAKRGEI